MRALIGIVPRGLLGPRSREDMVEKATPSGPESACGEPHTSDFMEIPATNKSFRIGAFAVVRFRTASGWSTGASPSG